MNMRRIVALLAAAGPLLSPVGCRRTQDAGPPKIDYGQTECERCKMIISEVPYAAALVHVVSGRMQKTAYDDIGCLLRQLAARDHVEMPKVYVHDFSTRRWIAADAATFLHCDDLQTPMGSGIVAFEDAASAESFRKSHKGAIRTFGELLQLPDPTPQTNSDSNERSAP
ncbi:MAG: nitrous oxide reductase accessory protein NosL [Phycisphaerae bacterium]